MSVILNAANIVVRFNDRTILDGAALAIQESDRVGMVGRNGSGKSTFLKILAGLHAPDSGELTRQRDLVVGYLPQAFELDPNLTVIENIRTGARHILDLIQEFESLPADSRRHEDLEHRIQSLDGWNLDNRIATAISHLNCPSPDKPIHSLSGGELRRVGLCRAIIGRPDLLILDEPTNHLDTESIEWMADYLQSYPGAFLVVTHDRYFLDRATSRIVEVAQGKTFTYTGNYTDYLLARAEREAMEANAEHKREMFVRRELDWVRRGPKARTTKSKSRLDHFFEIAGQAPPEIDPDMDLVIPPPPPLGNRVVELVQVGMELGGRQLFSGVNLEFAPGRRLGITGRNGLGKTTLLRIMLGQLQPSSGTVKVGQLTEFNYVDQGRLQLNEEHTVLQEMSDGTEFVLFGDHRLSLRAYLKRFLFTDERIATQVKHLSGGERSRLLLARILKRRGNFLVLDEPTNDLDLNTLRILEEALIAFPGVVVVVSHDRYFLNRVCTHILAFEGEGRVLHNVGNYDDYVVRRDQMATASRLQMEPAPAKKNAADSKMAAKNRPRRLTYTEMRELEGMEAAIEIVETNIARIESLFTQPDFHRQYGPQAGQLTQDLASEKERLACLYDRWQELEAISSQADVTKSSASSSN